MCLRLACTSIPVPLRPRNVRPSVEYAIVKLINGFVVLIFTLNLAPITIRWCGDGYVFTPSRRRWL